VKVAILGAGPTGMMAAWAAERNGHEPVIFAGRTTASEVNDDTFLQRPLPDLGESGMYDSELTYAAAGTAEGYAVKVYGDPEAQVSWTSVAWGTHPIWWLKPVYERLFERYASSITKLDLTPEMATVLETLHPLTLSTIPATSMCEHLDEHRFEERSIWLERQRTDSPTTPVMVYNGNEEISWFRFTRLNGWLTWEHAKAPSTELQVHKGKKFISNTCTCHPSIQRVGRLAQWKRGVLNHHAFEQTTSILASAGLGKGA